VGLLATRVGDPLAGRQPRIVVWDAMSLQTLAVLVSEPRLGFLHHEAPVVALDFNCSGKKVCDGDVCPLRV
jgi:hypothetical protein